MSESYCSFVEHESQDWTAQLTKTVGRRVAYYRQRCTDKRGHKLTAQGLAELCTELGLPTGRAAIAKLESGIRQSITVAELVVLAKALGVPAAVLMYPLGELDRVEVTPGDYADPLTAIFWFAGQDRDFPGTAAEKGTPLDLFMLHRRTVIAMLADLPVLHDFRALRRKGAGYQGEQPYPPLPDEVAVERELEFHASVLRTTRDAIRKLGLKPPALLPVLAYIDREETADGSR